MTSITRRRLLVVTVAIVLVVLLTVVVQVVLAAPGSWPISGTYGNTGGDRYENALVQGGAYRLQSNFWNPAVSGGYTQTYDTDNTAWSVSQYTANSYFPAGDDPNCNLEPFKDPGDPNQGTYDPDCNWAGVGGFYELPLPYPNEYDISTNNPRTYVTRQIHAPASYPDIYMGCHWGNCTKDPGATTNTGKPFPIQVQSVASLQSNWAFTVPGGTNPIPSTSGVWDAAYDIWLDTGTRLGPNNVPYLPNNLPGMTYVDNQLVINGQADGTEIMIWANSSGYENSASGNPIRPAGHFDTTVSINGKLWDVWTARVHSYDYPVAWNIVSYVLSGSDPNNSADDKIVNLNMDTAPFLHDAMTRQCYPETDDLRFGPEQRGPGAAQSCAEPDWWLTSIQAGFEIWHLPQEATMSTQQFSVTPVVLSGANTGNRSLDNGTPLVHWADNYNIEATGCTGGGSASYTIATFDDPATPEVEPTISWSTTLDEDPDGSGRYVGVQSPPLHDVPGGPMHGYANTTVNVTCPSGQTLTATGLVFIDPSGRVFDLDGKPIEGATVTLLYSPSGSQTGPFTAVPNQNAGLPQPIMSPANVDNPDTTNKYGYYRWDVIPGWYKVRAQKAECGAAVESPAKQVTADNPVTNLDLVLACGGGGGSGLSVQITPMSDWQTGYCRNVIITNTTAAPVDWKVTFTLVDGGTIDYFWNVIWSQNGNQVTAEGVGWNNILQPGQSSHSLGFCAKK